MKSLVLISLFLFFTNLLHAQSLGKGYYVVVGAYAASKETYAQKFVDNLKKEGFNAMYAKDGKRKLFLVYVERYEEFNPSLKGMKNARKDRFPEAWVRIIRDNEVTANETTTGEVAKDEVKEKVPAPIESKKEDKAIEQQQPSLTEIKEPQEKAAETDSVAAPPPAVTTSPSSPPSTSPPTPSSPRLTFNMFDATTSKPIDGQIEIVDADRARLIQKK